MADSALTNMVTDAGRAYRLASTARTDMSGLLSGKEIRKVVDVTPDIAAHISQITNALTEDEKAAMAWQKALAAAAKLWEAALAELDKQP
jgi:hypothetical protein